MFAIYKRELRSYFNSMIGYIFIAFLLLNTGIYFTAYNLRNGYPAFSYTLSSAIIIFTIGIPLLSMRSFAEERKNKTDQILLTSPVSLVKVVLGKYFAMITVIAIPNIIFLLYPLIIKMNGTAYIKMDYIAIVIFFLLGCVYAAIGIFFSTLTESQIIAYITAAALLLVIFLWDGITGFLPKSTYPNLLGLVIIWICVGIVLAKMFDNKSIGFVSAMALIIPTLVLYKINSEWFSSLLINVFGKLALTSTVTNIINNNTLDISGVVLYFSVIFIFLFLTVEVIQKRRLS